VALILILLRLRGELATAQVLWLSTHAEASIMQVVLCLGSMTVVICLGGDAVVDQ
jgi:hypothetical protein